MISIIVPIYNSEKYIKRCIESVISQTLNEWELILIDDGSTDSSCDICEEYSNNSQIIFKKIRNSGVSNARNVGLKLATGKYVMFLDSDDYLKNNCLEECLKIFENTNVDIIKFNYVKKIKNLELKNKYIIETDKIISKDMYKEKLYTYVFETDNLCNVADAIFLKKTIENIEFDKNISLGEDFWFFINAVKASNSIYYIDKYYYCYDVSTVSATRSKDINKNLRMLTDAINANRKIDNILGGENKRYLKSLRNFDAFIKSLINNYSYCEFINVFKEIIENNRIIAEELQYIKANCVKFNEKKFFCLSKKFFYTRKVKIKIKLFIKKLLSI